MDVDVTLTVLSTTPAPTPLTPFPSPVPTSCYESTACCDLDDGAEDRFGGEVCADYVGNTGWCGNYDDSDFTSEEMCCACGGGTGVTPSPTYPRCYDDGCCNTDYDAVDEWGEACAPYYDTMAESPYYDAWVDTYCSTFDDDDFSSKAMCCACGGETTGG